MGDRQRHPKKDLEALLQFAEGLGWRVVRKGKYFSCYCPCPAKHRESIAMTPSDPNYGRNKKNKISKCRKER
ncbi:MAG: hypothetical protein ACXIVQ_12315 [Acidimicrobiales bacterium]